MHNNFTSLDRPDALTERETEILRLMAGGYSNKEIASSLGVAEGTVKNHVSNILSKLGVRDRTRAVLKAFELGQRFRTWVLGKLTMRLLRGHTKPLLCKSLLGIEG